MSDQIIVYDCIGGGNYISTLDVFSKENPQYYYSVLIKASGWSERQAWKLIRVLARNKVAGIIPIYEWHDTHSFGTDNIPFAVKCTKKVNKIANRFPETTFIPKPWLEYVTSSRDTIKDLYNSMKEEMSVHMDIMLNPMDPSQPYLKRSDVIVDLHNKHYVTLQGVRQAFHYDGQEMINADLKRDLARTAKCEFFGLWVKQFNGLYSEKDGRKREDRDSWPPLQLLYALKYMIDNPKGRTKFPGAPEVYKSFAESHGDGNPREFKPVLLMRVKDKGGLAVKVKGKVILTIPYDKQYNHDTRLSVYRCPMWGYELQNLAKINGSKRGRVNLWANGKNVGKVLPTHRDSYFRD